MDASVRHAALSLALFTLSGCLFDWASLRRDGSVDAASDAQSDGFNPVDVDDRDAEAADAAVPELDASDASATRSDASDAHATDAPSDRDAAMDAGDPRDAAAVDSAMDANDAARDAMTGPDAVDAGASDARDALGPGADSGGGCSGSVVVNEVQHSGSAGGTDEFIEIQNNGASEVSLDGWQILYISSAGTTSQSLFTFSMTDRLTPGAQMIVAGAMHQPAASLRRIAAGRGISTPAGVALVDRTLRKVDSVAFGMVASTHPYLEPEGGAPAPNPGTAQSISRTPSGRDTNVNATDFTVSPPTPGAPTL
jgi:hypothetical protein